MNRKWAYYIRKYMPDSQLLHKYLAKKKLKEFKKQLIPESDIQLGEQNYDSMKLVVNKYSTERTAQIEKLKYDFNQYLKRAEIKYATDEMERQETYMIFNCLAYGFAPDECIYYQLSEKTLEKKKEYIADIDRKMLQYIMSDFKDLQYVFDKAATYEKFHEYYKREEISVAGKEDLKKFKAFTKRHKYIVIKEVSASCGHGVRIEEVTNENVNDIFESIIKQGKCSIEEKIEQSKLVSIFNESSVNTLRVITFNTKKGIVIGPCFFRTGRKGSIVDNAGSGGVFAGVDRKLGVLDSIGYDEYLNTYVKHPDSGITYFGFQLPEWDNCINLVKEMCAKVPRIGYIGWDLAYTDKGWILVEANGGSQFVTQICYGKGCKNEVAQYVADRNIY